MCLYVSWMMCLYVSGYLMQMPLLIAGPKAAGSDDGKLGLAARGDFKGKGAGGVAC